MDILKDKNTYLYLTLALPYNINKKIQKLGPSCMAFRLSQEESDIILSILKNRDPLDLIELTASELYNLATKNFDQIDKEYLNILINRLYQYLVKNPAVVDKEIIIYESTKSSIADENDHVYGRLLTDIEIAYLQQKGYKVITYTEDPTGWGQLYPTNYMKLGI
jgi:hypothetical protein